MAGTNSAITDEQAALIEAARLCFVSTADPGMKATTDGIGPNNLSPKGGTPLNVLDRNRVAYLDYKGSGDETA